MNDYFNKIVFLKKEVTSNIFVFDKYFSNKLFCPKCSVVDVKKYNDLFFEEFDELLELLLFFSK